MEDPNTALMSGPVPVPHCALHLFLVRSECPSQTFLADVSFFILFQKLKDDFFIAYSVFESKAESKNSHACQKLTSSDLNRRYLSAQMLAGFKQGLAG